MAQKLNLLREPPIPSTTEFSTIQFIRQVISELDEGKFRRPALLIERMLWNPRLRGAVGTRLNGLISMKVRWKPVRSGEKAARAAREMAEDWPLMAPTPQRQQFNKWGLLLGASFAQRVPMESPTSGRRIYRLRPYWPGFATWSQREDLFEILVRGGTVARVKSTSDRIGATDPAASPWVLHEPFGEHSWREALVHALWRPWFGHDNSFRDLNRASEKYGVGALKLKFPVGSEDDAAELKQGLRTMNSEGVLPLPQYPDRGPDAGFDVVPLEFQGGSGFDVIDRALNASAIAIAIVLLGHNLTTEVKGGSYAAAGIGEFIRSDIKANDGEAEFATIYPQLAQPWALENYGDPELAPIAEYISDPPAVNEAMSRTYQLLALAIRELKTAAPNVDIDALLERFMIPLRVVDKEMVQVAAPVVEVPAAPAQTPVPGETVAGGPESTSQVDAGQLELAPTDLASIVRVDEGRKSVGLDPEGGEVGGLWIREHSTRLASALKAEEPAAPMPPEAPKEPVTP